MLPDRGHLAIEIDVENLHHGFGRQPIRQCCKAAQIRQPDCRAHGLGMAAAYLATKNSLAGAVAHISVEQDRGGAAQTEDLDQPRQRQHNCFQCRQLIIAESTRRVRGPTRSVDRAIDEPKRQRDIVGDALHAHVVEEGKTLVLGIVDPVSDLPPLAKHDGQRAASKFRRILDIEVHTPDHDLGARPPDEIAAENIGVQRPNEDADAPQRQPGPHQALAGLRQQQGSCGRPTIDQPVGNFLQFGCVHEKRICGASDVDVKAGST
jgi:hypothetical protein